MINEILYATFVIYVVGLIMLVSILLLEVVKNGHAPRPLTTRQPTTNEGKLFAYIISITMWPYFLLISMYRMFSYLLRGAKDFMSANPTKQSLPKAETIKDRYHGGK